MNYPKRSCTHRMKGHDYRATWKYHLTLLKNPDAPYFCHLADGWREAALTHRREAVKMEYTPAEKAIRVEAEVLGARHILITHTPMPDRYKPAAHDFDLCAAGRLLILSAPTQQPWLPPNPSRPCPVIGRARPIPKPRRGSAPKKSGAPEGAPDLWVDILRRRPLPQ